MPRSRPISSPPFDGRAAAPAGVAAAVAYLVEMAIDLDLVGHNADDLVFLGEPFVGRRHGWAKPVGATVNMVNRVNLALAYAVLGERRLPGPPWWRGVLVANLENVVLYPLTLLTDRRHPAVRGCRLDRYGTRPAFAQSVLRHVAYGAVLGAVYDRLRRRDDGSRGDGSLPGR